MVSLHAGDRVPFAKGFGVAMTIDNFPPESPCTTTATGSELCVLRPCPFCGGDAEILNIEDGENAGGSCVSCTRCQASSNVEFEFKENFVSNWNRRTSPERSALKGLTEHFDDYHVPCIYAEDGDCEICPLLEAARTALQLEI